jgi:hypothetical protein
LLGDSAASIIPQNMSQPNGRWPPLELPGLADHRLLPKQEGAEPHPLQRIASEPLKQV